MKKIFLILFFIPFCMLGQDFLISKYEKYDNEKKGEQYRKLLKLDRSDIVLKVNEHKYLVFKNNEVYKVNAIETENLIRNKQKLSDKESLLCNQILDSLKSMNPFFLNVTENEEGSKMVIEDEGTWKLELFKGDYTVDYSSYAPYDYIEYKARHYQERIKLLNYIKQLNTLFYDEEYEKIVKADTIYLIYDKNKELNNLKLKTTAHKNLLVYSFLFSDSKELNFQAYKMNYKKANKKSIHENNTSVRINLDIINKYRYDYIVNLFNRKKVIYIIDPKDSKGKNVVLKRVNFVNTN